MNAEPELFKNRNPVQTKLVKLSSQYAHSQLKRQTPGMTGRWGSYQFTDVGEITSAADFWCVLDGLREAET
ncbi:MAG: hypothetical protein ACR2OL_09250, partial [Anderseniella sp.]